ncbi:hypothetical protein PoB_006424400 [Plakobranchus ocellatus]|uniref:Uncharacterized protein n=1 Tax=Plakobranchus ocellatus TaxID=259542 RepID=A0AAV4D0R2_9GAST|nr:hypothetical protein PoB_006424400 [Plakobranchus ocellatus]
MPHLFSLPHTKKIVITVAVNKLHYLTIKPVVNTLVDRINNWSIGDTVDSRTARRSAGSFLLHLQIRAPLPAPWPEGGPESLRPTYSSPQQGDLWLSSPPSGQGVGGGARTRDRRIPADVKADSLFTVPPTPPEK